MRLVTVVISLSFCTLANAQVLTLAEVKAKNGVQLTTADLKQLMPDAKVVTRTVAGSTRYWNNGNGTFVASSDGMGGNQGRYAGGTGQGAWRVDENLGTYCVTIQWTWGYESWCRYILKAGDKFYGFDKLSDNNQRSGELEFSK